MFDMFLVKNIAVGHIHPHHIEFEPTYWMKFFYQFILISNIFLCYSCLFVPYLTWVYDWSIKHNSRLRTRTINNIDLNPYCGLCCTTDLVMLAWHHWISLLLFNKTAKKHDKVRLQDMQMCFYRYANVFSKD